MSALTGVDCEDGPGILVLTTQYMLSPVCFLYVLPMVKLHHLTIEQAEK